MKRNTIVALTQKASAPASGFTLLRYGLAAAIALLAGSPAKAAMGNIGLNFQGRTSSDTIAPTLPATASAGVVPQVNWNNFDNKTDGNNGASLPLVDETGAATPVTISFTANDNWNNDDALPVPSASNGNDVLMFGCIKQQNANTSATFTFENVPASPTGWYDLIVYTAVNGDGIRLNTSIGTKRFYTVEAHGWVAGSAVNAAAPGSPAIPARTFRQAKNEIDPTFGGAPDLGNYIRFAGIAPDAGGSITLTATYISGGDGLGISGLQLINGTAAPVDTTPPVPLVTRTTPANGYFLITFSEPLDATAATAGNFTLNNGATVSAAEFLDPNDPTTVKVTTSTLTPGTAYTVTVAGVKDAAQNAFNGTATFRTANRATGDITGFTTLDGYQVNGGATASGGILTLTSGAGGQTRSVFNTNVVNINNFNAQFTYRATGDADGAGFVLQGDPRGAAAIGGGGGQLAFTGIQNAVGFLLNIYDPNGKGYSVSIDGTTGINTYTDAGGINLSSGHPILVNLTYSQATMNLHVNMQDLTTGTIFDTDVTVDIKGVVGSDYAFVGFTGATGGAASVQTVQDFTYSANAIAAQPIRILTQPHNIHGLTNTTVTFEVAVSGPATFQWFKGSTPITGATSGTLDIGPLTDADNNTLYHVVVTGGAGTTGNTVTSSDAKLTVGHLEFIPGYMRYDRFDGASLANMEDSTFVDPPSFQTLRTSMSNPTTSPNLDSFSDRTYGYFVPKDEGDYTFYLACDDNGSLWISTDEDPANKYQIAAQARWSNANEWTVLDGNDPANIANKRSDMYLQGVQGAASPVPIHLKAGQKYYIEMDHNEGGGGDASMVTYTAFGAPPPSNGTASALSGDLIGALILTGEAINFTSQPASVSVPAATKATFSVAVSNPIAFYQWQKNGVNIPGATSSTYTTDFVTLSDNNAKYRVVVTIPGSSATSADATLTVTPSSSTAALPVGAGSINASEIGIEFDTLLDTVSGANVANYSVSGGGVISSAKVETMSDGVKAFSAVKLLLSTPITGANANVSIVGSGLKDVNGNTVAATTLPITVQKLSHKDIGNLPGDPINAGDAVAAGSGAFDVQAGGSDIYNNADGFHFVYAPVKGDFDVSVRVQYVLPVNNWSAGALMLRDTLNPDARQWHVKVTPPAVATVDGGTGAASFETNRRLMTGSPTAGWSDLNAVGGDKSVAKYPDQYIRLTRTNQTLSVYRKDPVNTDWVLVAQEDVTAQQAVDSTGALVTDVDGNPVMAPPLPDTVYVGMATTSHNNSPGAQYITTVLYRNFVLLGNIDTGGGGTDINLTVARNANGSLTLTWNGTGKLQSTPALGVGAVWSDVQNGGTSGVTITPATTGNLFYRVQQTP